MALVKCEECGKEISDKASKCPNCGAKKGINTGILLALLSLGCLLISWFIEIYFGLLNIVGLVLSILSIVLMKNKKKNIAIIVANSLFLFLHFLSICVFFIL